jgi:ubiquinone/menaquinone biosynthesis C-methylase UbiE
MDDPEEVRSRTREYYDAVGRTYYDLFKDELQEKEYDRRLLDRFVALLGPRARVCDAGCGPCGHTTRYLAQAGLDVIGIDLSPECVALARSANPGLHFQVMAMEEMGFPDASFDGILAYYSILNTPKANLPGLLTELRRALKPRGRLLVVVKEGDGEGLIDDPLGTVRRTFFANFRQYELRNFVEAAGFQCAFAETREPYGFEIPVRRIYVIAEKPGA